MTNVHQGDVYDVIGVGFGPANLALAVALEEAEVEQPLRGLFLEARESFVWHPGMLIEDSMLQVTVLKDLATVHNPCSRFTFLNYLKEKDRLFEWLNLRDLYPTRIEFNDYLTWAADKLSHLVRYGQRVEAIDPVEGDDGVELLRVRTIDADGQRASYLTRNAVVATGGRPVGPKGVDVEASDRVFHSIRFVQKLESLGLPRDAEEHFVVVGSGQSAGEIFEYLMDHFPRAKVTATIRRFAYKPVDESDFTNRVFYPRWVDFYNQLPDDKRRPFFETLKDVNYAVIDHPLIRRINQKLYRQRVIGENRAELRPFLQLEGVREQPDGLEILYRDVMHDAPVAVDADYLVLCTGFEWPKEHPLIEPLAGWFERDGRGGYQVERDYRIAARDGFGPSVYLQGYCEDTHGISETVLSLLPVRANDILSSVVDRRAEQAPAVAIS